MNKLILSLILLGFLNISSSNTRNNVGKYIDQYITNLITEKQFSGAVLVAQHGDIVLSKGYGFACNEFKVPNTPQTKFTIASITKLITSIAIMQLCEKKLLNLDDQISMYIPDMQYENKVTIHHLLSHSSGIPDIFVVPEVLTKIKFPINVESRISLIKHLPLEFVPGERHQYSQSNYYILTYIIEVVSDMSYEAFVKQNIFMPLKMHSTGFNLRNEMINDLAYGYVNVNGSLYKPDYFDMSWAYGTGGLYSTIHDLYFLDRALYTEQLLNASSLNTMITPYVKMHQDSYYGYGCEISECFNKKYVASPGKMFGFSSYLMHFVQDDVVIILLGNLEQTLDETNNIVIKIASMLFDI